MGRRLLALLLLLARLVAQPLPETTGFRARRSLEGSELFIPAADGCPCPDGCRTLTSSRGTLGDGFWPRCEAAQAGGMYRCVRGGGCAYLAFALMPRIRLDSPRPRVLHVWGISYPLAKFPPADPHSALPIEPFVPPKNLLTRPLLLSSSPPLLGPRLFTRSSHWAGNSLTLFLGWRRFLYDDCRNMEEMREICWWVIDARTGGGDSGALLSFTALQTDLSVGTDSINVYECSDIDCSGNSEIYYTPEVQQALQGQLPSDGATYNASTGIFYVRFKASLWRASTGFVAVWAQQSQDGDGSCGNGVLDGVFEACDDGGLDDGDGCSSECKVERGWNCSSGSCACTCCGVDARTEGEIVRMGGYSENERCDMTVGNGSNLGGGWLAVTKLSTQPMHDNLTVWACADASCSSMGSPLAVLSGGDASEGVGRAYRSDTGVFRLRFESDGCINEGGFSVRWSNTQPVCNDTVVHWLEGCDPPGPRCSDTCGLLHPGYDCESARSVGGACTPATTCGDGVVAAGEEECEGSQGCSGCMCAAGGAGGGCDWTAPAHIDVGSAVAAAGEGDVIRFKKQIALLDKARHLVVSSKNVTLIASGEGRGLPFGGYGASISVLPGAALTMEGFQVSGGLSIDVAEGGALVLNSMAIDHVRIQQTRAKVTMFNCTVEVVFSLEFCPVDCII
jgi:cysteine-rich repeat protein